MDARETVTDRVAGAAALIQSDFMAGEHGNFEVVANVADPSGCRTAAPCIRHYFHINDDFASPWLPAQVVAYTGKSQKVCQLTGDDDREWGYPTVNRTTQHEIWGTDLGQPVEHNGRIFYFFGDTVTTRPKEQDNWNHDSYASSTDYTPEDCLHLDFLTEDGSDRFRALTIPGVSMEAFETPTGGFSANGNLYVFASSRWNGQYHTRSVLARSRDDGRTFARMGDVSNGKFINISPVVVDSARWPDLPTPGQGVLLWASGRYRGSNVYLAYLPLDRVDGNPRPFLHYLTGVSPVTGRPNWDDDSGEDKALPLFDQPCVGELSVTWNPHLRRWLMLYNCDNPRGINYRTASQPWGPWSEPGVLFDPRTDGGYCHFMHDGGANCDRVSDPNREDVDGGEYGPYVIPSLTTATATETTIYYTLSTWNPYEVMLMRATLSRNQIPVAELPIFVDALAPGWQDWSWDTIRADVTEPRRGGASALAVTHTAPWAGLYFHADPAINTAGYSDLRFWIHGGSIGGQQIVIKLNNSDAHTFPVTATADAWMLVDAPLSALGNPATISDIYWQDAAGAAQPTYYLDDIALVGDSDAPPTLPLTSFLPLITH